MNRLDRPGVFKARPVAMGLKNGSEGSKSAAVWIEFQIEAQLDGTEWTSWAEYEDHSIIGDFWIIKKDGSINQPTVARLAEVLDWDGNPDTICGNPPDIPVQITVGEETYNGQTRLKVQWLNPVDYQGGVASATPEQVKQINAQFGSLLRAAAGAARKTKTTAPKGKPPAKTAPKTEPVTAQAAIPYEGQFDPDDPNNDGGASQK